MGLEEAGPPPDEPAAAARLRRVDELVGHVELAAVGLSMAMLIITAVTQVLMDKVGDHRPTWPYELIRNGVFFVAMSGAALAAQRKGMFNMDLVTRKLSRRVRAYVRVFSAVLVAILCALVVRSAVELRANTFEVKEAHEYISHGHAYLALIGGASLIAFHFVVHAIIEITYLAGGQIPPDPPHGGH
jgi:TRAP-type C4-dicarboxylate transport system permease small subunit